MNKISTAVCAAGVTLWLTATASFPAHDRAAQVLAAARQAYGRANWNTLGLLVETGAEHASGLDGQWRLAEDTASGRRHLTADFGVFRAAEVWDGHDHWRQDASGGVHALNSVFMRGNAATQMWLARRDFLRPGAGGARIDDLGARQDDHKTYDVLRATPRGGQAAELWFDTASGLLARSIWEMPIDDVTVRYEDYRRVGDALVPFKTATQEGDSEPDIVTVARAAFVAHAPNGEFAPPQTPDDSTVDGGKATVPMAVDGFITIAAKLNGKGPFSFILDTGGHDILSPEAAAALGLHGQGAGTAGGSGAGTLTEQYTRVDRLEIGGVSLRDQSFVILPLQYDTVEMGAKPPLAGILGLELFERFAMELNYGANTLTFRPLKNAPPGRGVPVPISFSDDQPIFTAKIDGIAGDNGLDTGNGNALVVQGRWAQRVGLAPRMRKGLPTAGFGSGGISQNWAVRADVEVAGRRFARIVASYSQDKKGAFSSRTEAGNIGNQIYRNFTLGFDYRRGTVWFDPLPGPPLAPEPYSRAGIGVYKKTADAFTVAIVLPGAPAAEAGIAAGDDIVSVDGVAARQLSGADMRHILRRPPGAKLTLDVVHGGQKRPVTLILRELLP